MDLKNYKNVLLKRSTEDLTIKEKEKFLGYLLIIPSVVLVAAAILYPLVYNVYLSFTEVPLHPDESPVWVGLENYATMLTDDRFWTAFWNSILFTLFSSLIATAAGLGVALLFRRKFRGRRIVRGIVLLPYVLPIIAAAFVWRFMLNPIYGVVPYSMQMTGIYTGELDLLGEPSIAIWTVILVDSWRVFPFAFLLLMARVQSIPPDMYEAAKLDGAGRFARFKDITLPELKYVIATVFLLRWIWNFNAFADVWLLTREVPTLPIYTYLTAFSSFDQGLAAAISMLLFLFLIAFVLLYVAWFADW